MYNNFDLLKKKTNFTLVGFELMRRFMKCHYLTVLVKHDNSDDY